MTFERCRRGTLALLCKAHVVAEHAPAPSNRDPDPPQRTSRTVSSIAAQVTRPSQTPAHAAIHARANAIPIALPILLVRLRSAATQAGGSRQGRSPVAPPESTLLFRKPARPPRKIPPASDHTAAPDPSCSTLRARSGSCSAGDEKNDKNNHPCTSINAFAHSSENMSITSRRFAQSVAPCSKASHAEKNVPRAQC